jgi:hypothetical protein
MLANILNAIYREFLRTSLSGAKVAGAWAAIRLAETFSVEGWGVPENAGPLSRSAGPSGQAQGMPHASWTSQARRNHFFARTKQLWNKALLQTLPKNTVWGRRMFEVVTAILGLFSVGVFVAHAIDAYRAFWQRIPVQGWVPWLQTDI